MTAIAPLYQLLDLKIKSLSYNERILLEAQIFIAVYKEIKNELDIQYRNYMQIIKVTHIEDDHMLDIHFARLIINDLIKLEEYTLEGIAYYTDVPLDILQEILFAENNNPSAKLIRKLIELHYSVRENLYKSILRKIILECEKKEHELYSC